LESAARTLIAIKTIEGESMQVTLRYGHEGLPLNLPDDWHITVIQKKPMPIIDNPADSVVKALANPVGCGKLTELARGKSRACILICDVTRPVPNSLLLPLLIKELLAAGLAADQIQVLVATGLHRPNQDDELREVVGDDWVYENFLIENHYARNDRDHVDIGTTKAGTPVKLDRRFVAADLRIAVGLVEPHFMAGYSGGRKIITPGVAHQDTITYLHSAKFMEHPRAANCIIDGNPLHLEQVEIVSMIGGALAVNVVIDEHRRLSFVNFGDIIKSHIAAINYLRPYAEVFVRNRFQTVVTSSAGYPLDKTYYQTVKGMVGAQEILTRGGDLFIASEISEGMGSSEYVAAQQKLIDLGPEAFIESIKPQPHAAIDAWQTEMQIKAMRVGKLHMYTDGLSAQQRALTGVEIVKDLEAAVIRSAQRHKTVAVIPEGPYVVPFVKGEGPAAD
jgi:nickel-dependent lactate racemase